MKIKARYGHFNWIAPFYDKVFGATGHQNLIDHLQLTPGLRLLDVGGGTGRVAQHLVERGTEVVVVDPSPNMISGTTEKGLHAVRGLSEALPFPTASIDRILIVDAFHHFADQRLAARDLLRVLRPGGRIVIEEPDIRHLSVKFIAIAEKLALMQSHFFSPQALAKLFEQRGAHLVAITDDRISAHIVLEK